MRMTAVRMIPAVPVLSDNMPDDRTGNRADAGTYGGARNRAGRGGTEKTAGQRTDTSSLLSGAAGRQ